MKTNSLITTRTALATIVAGAVLLFAGCGQDDRGHPPSDDRGQTPAHEAHEAHRIPEADRKDGAPKAPRPKKKTSAAKTAKGKLPIPDAVARALVENAIDDNNYGHLVKLRDKAGQIEDPALRLRLLEGLAWFEETAVSDALCFLADPDAKVAAKAGEIVSSCISSVERQEDREQVYKVALKLMAKDSPDRDILLATLEGDRKSVVMHVLRDLSSTKDSDPGLWRRLTEVYETSFGRPYVSHVDALIHYAPGEDR